MKASIAAVFSAVTLITVQTALSQNPGDGLFAGIQVHTIDIRFPQAHYWDSLMVYHDQGNEQYIPATVIADGVTYDSVGVRFKGNSSFTHPNNKKSFRLSFDNYHSDQRWDGLKGVHLNNCWEDPTLMREKVHLDFCTSGGIPAPRANFAVLSINDTLFAFYSLVEHVDKRFLNSRYGTTDGDLFKAVDGFGTTDTLLSDFRWLGSDTAAYTRRYEIKTDEFPEGWFKLVNFIDTLNHASSPATALPAAMNMVSLYRAIGADILFGNLDSYVGSSRNFYIYFDPVFNRIEWIIWDVSLSFGGFPSGGVSSVENLSLTYVRSAAQRPLFGKVIATPVLRNAYLRTLCGVFNSGFTTSRLFPHIDSVASIIRPFVYQDTRKMYTNQQFETNIVSDVTVGSGRKPGLKSFITARRASVLSQLSTLGVSCDLAVSEGDLVINEFMAQNTAIPDSAGEFEDWIELHNNTADTIDLGGLYLSDDPAQPAKWQFPPASVIAPSGYLIVWADEDSGQAGLHANFKLSAGGESILLSNTDVSILDTVSFGVQTANISMARIPDGTGGFVYARPTFNGNNGSSIVINAGDVVLNEFMAQNDSILDPAGEAEDWIEIFNTTGNAIDLGGTYLSNDPLVPTKWRFAGNTTIGASAFLIVWADGDTLQSGIHASFDLPAGGGRLRFSNTDGSVLDSTTFGSQTASRSLARVPNGTGPFVLCLPTFNANNNGVAPGEVVINEFSADNDSIADPAGETDDWIEFYNNASREIDLSGLFLSDNFNLPTKWSFPEGTTIPAHGYRIVWADQDTGQVGLHALFALSASGERIVLSNTDLSILDSVTFGAQPTNRSMARVPNGTGPFVQGMPTFGLPNETTTTINVSVGGGWQMISNPVATASDSLREIFPSASHDYAFSFAPAAGYMQSWRLAGGTGYWTKFPTSTIQPISGTIVRGDTVQVGVGWNMIGSISSPVDTAAILSIPPGIRSSVFFAYALGYAPAALINPGSAYWVKAASAGSLVLHTTAAPGEPPRTAAPAGWSMSLDRLMEIRVSDATGAGQSLYLGTEQDAAFPVSLFELPPSAPAGALDVRFASGRMVEVPAPGTAPLYHILVAAASYPVTVGWNVRNGDSGFRLRAGETVDRVLTGEGTIVIGNDAVKDLFLRRRGADVPDRYALEQNYPNPFNPITVIRYQLPERTHVTLKVFDLLGREVATLLDESQEAGCRSVTFDAAGGFASGVYLYRLVAGGFVETRKLMLLK
jgi:hypothetical protein